MIYVFYTPTWKCGLTIRVKHEIIIKKSCTPQDICVLQPQLKVWIVDQSETRNNNKKVALRRIYVFYTPTWRCRLSIRVKHEIIIKKIVPRWICVFYSPSWKCGLTIRVKHEIIIKKVVLHRIYVVYSPSWKCGLSIRVKHEIIIKKVALHRIYVFYTPTWRCGLSIRVRHEIIIKKLYSPGYVCSTAPAESVDWRSEWNTK